MATTVPDTMATNDCVAVAPEEKNPCQEIEAEAMSTNGCDAVATEKKNPYQEIEAEVMAEFDRLDEIADEIFYNAKDGMHDCDEFWKMVEGEP